MFSGVVILVFMTFQGVSTFFFPQRISIGLFSQVILCKNHESPCKELERNRTFDKNN